MRELPGFNATLNARYDEITQQLNGGFLSESIEAGVDLINVDFQQRQALRHIHQCNLCKLSCQYKVPGTGNPDSPVMIVGEGPGKDELTMRMPFVGAAGTALMVFLKQLGIARHRVYLTNVTHCNTIDEGTGKLQTPGEDEVTKCLFHLIHEIQFVQPKVIIALGNPAMWGLTFDFDKKISQERGKWIDIHSDYGVPAKLMCTWHPSYLIRQKGADFDKVKKEMWYDLYTAFGMAKQLAPSYDFNKKPIFV